ncbi:MAG: flagellar motor switch protein FliG [Gammaproteobacteria bacterium]|nr:flagellar motor switch protein FliG [Gammaproteobacteria bacterium]MDH5735296.1 flagellar motor switch protein FliG [Gammaproteobacteria bacterium]
MDKNKPSELLTGVERAAVLLLSIGSDKAAAILKHLSPKEVQVIGVAMAAMQHITKKQMDIVMEDFVGGVHNQTSMGIGADDYIRDMMVNALGEDKAKSMIDRILMGTGNKGLEALKWMDPRAVAELIRLEHPQIIAIVLSYLDPDQSADVVKFLPERARPDIMMRVAALDGIPPSALRELDSIMEKQFSGSSSNVAQSSMGGLRAAANILNFMDSSDESAILDNISEYDSEMSEGIRDMMFVFDNLAEIDDRGIQVILREISTETLTLALKAADVAIKEKIFKNMSKRASQMLQEDLEVRGPVRLADAEAAQKEILATARRLADDGDISLGGSGEEYV